MKNYQYLPEEEIQEVETIEMIDTCLGEHHHEINMGTGACTLCDCKAYVDDGKGFSRCTCGDRKMDHS